MTGPSFKWSGVVYLPHILGGNVLSRRISNCVGFGEMSLWGPVKSKGWYRRGEAEKLEVCAKWAQRTPDTICLADFPPVLHQRMCDGAKWMNATVFERYFIWRVGINSFKKVFVYVCVVGKDPWAAFQKPGHGNRFGKTFAQNLFRRFELKVFRKMGERACVITFRETGGKLALPPGAGNK